MITIERKKLEQALHELEGIPVYKKYGVRISNAITALNEALAQTSTQCEKQTAQEPVAWAVVGEGKFGPYEIGRETETNPSVCKYWANRGYSLVPLYTTLLAAQPAQEPVTHQFQALDGSWHPFIDAKHKANTEMDGSWPIRALYTTPQQRPWVGLTDNDYLNALDNHPYEGSDRELWLVLEAKLKEKNT